MRIALSLLVVLFLVGIVSAVDTVVVSSDNDADQGAAEVAASSVNATVVTVEWGSGDSNALSQITALSPKRVILIGGPLAVSAGLEANLRAKVASVERLDGEDRYETAALIAGRFFANSSDVLIIQGDDPATIKAKVASARASGIPILYVKKDGVPDKVKLKLKTLKFKEAKVEPSAETEDDAILKDLGNLTVNITMVNRTEKALAQIAEAEDRIGEAGELNITNSTNLAAQRMLAKAGEELSLAKDSLDAGKPGEAFGQAVAAENHAEAAIKIFRNRNVGWYKEKVDETDKEIREKGRDRIKREIEDEEDRTKLECEKKVVNGNVTRICTTEAERKRGQSKDKFEVGAKVGASGTLVDLELKFASSSQNTSMIAQEILSRLQVSRDNMSALLKLENETEDLKEEMEGSAKTEDNATQVKFEFKFPLNVTDRDGILTGIASRISSLTAEQVQDSIEVKAEKEEKKEGRKAEKD